LPSKAWPALHSIAIVVAGVPGLTGLVLTATGLVRSPALPRSLRVATIAFGALALVHAAWWTCATLAHDDHGWLAATLPGVQKVTAIVYLAWVALLAGPRLRSA
jgi:hypothetical protein